MLPNPLRFQEKAFLVITDVLLRKLRGIFLFTELAA